VVKTYFDLDNNQRILLAKECTETFDTLVAHAWGDWTITKIPSETASGEAERICHSEDDHEETVSVPKLTDGSVWSVSSYVPETCETEGKRIYTSMYGEVEAIVPAKGHKWGEYIITKEPTTSETGSAKRTCLNDESHVETITLPVLTDTLVWTKGASEVPSCLGNGYQIYSSKYGSVKVIIPATGHNFGEYVMTKAPTETITGVATRTCKNNAAHTETTSIPVLTDKFWTLSQIVDATCESAGYKVYTSTYGDVKVTIPAIGHHYGDWTIIKEPTVDTTGIAQRKCSHDASHVEEISIPKLTNETTWAIKSSTAATCEKDGHTIYTSIYGDVTITLPAIGHKYGSWIIVNTPTETEAGSVKRICANDSSHVETKDIPKLTDTSVWTVGSYTAPTCSVTGSRTYNSEYGSITVKIDALGHNYGDWDIVTEPSTTKTGSAKRICANDFNHVETITLPVLTDTSIWTLSDEEKATCDTAGYEVYTSKYGDVEISIPALRHNYGAWTITKEPTTSATGTAQRVCANNTAHKETKELPALTDTTVWTAGTKVDPECTVAGSQKYDSEYGSVTIALPATGHNYGAWEEVTPATTTSTGLRQKVCKNDPEHIITEVIPMLEEEPSPDESGDDT
jgi:ribosomal protein S19